jgi:hypothetical protein
MRLTEYLKKVIILQENVLDGKLLSKYYEKRVLQLGVQFREKSL